VSGAGGTVTGPGAVLPRPFFAGPALEVAQRLLGCVIEHQTAEGIVGVMLTEVEAYEGESDPASHAYRGRSQRNAVMFGPPGHAYVYFTYGMHFCVNLVCMPPGTASAVLLRAGRVVEGAELAASRRAVAGPGGRDLARGPARLCQALAIARGQNGSDVCDPASPLRVRAGTAAGTVPDISQGPRVGVNGAADWPWRFWLAGDPTVSAYRPHVPRRRGRAAPAAAPHAAGRTAARTAARTAGRTDGRTDGRTAARTDGRTDGRTAGDPESVTARPGGDDTMQR
jgi:DNA-3-methyladenine glycosylase